MVGKELERQMVAWRRHLHAHPEVATTEVKTSAYVAAELDRLNVPYERNIGGHGIVATLTRGTAAGCVGLRADMDALPIKEETGLPYASLSEGVMHACGHDGHTASLLGAAHLLVNDQSWSGTVRLIFQPAEEGAIGAAAMIRDGLVERFPVDQVFAFHNWPGLPTGTIAAVPGPIMAAGGRIRIVLNGKAAHAAMPHHSRDSLLAAGHLLTALQSIAARAVDPLEAAVISITTLQAGIAFNQITDQVTLGGTMRTLKTDVRDKVEEEIHRICRGIALTFGVEAKVSIQRTAPPTVNTQRAAALAALAAERIGAPVDRTAPPSLAGEDFAYLLEAWTGSMVWIGNGENCAGKELHSPAYDFNDAILPVAAQWFCEVAKLALQEN